MKNTLLSYLLIFVIAITPSLTFASDSLCKTDGYVVGFFNGVWNSKAEANIAVATLQNKVGLTHNGEKVAYELFYNHTGTSVGESAFQDVAEVFIQRAEEISPDFSGRFDVFWSTLSGDSDGFLSKVVAVVGGTNDLLIGLMEDLYTEVTTEVVAAISAIISNPPTSSDYARHSTRIQTLASQGAKVVLVAHSQGNLFVNNAYNASIGLSNFSSENIGVVHIAPASSITNGPHVLADIDAVINGLRTFGINSIPAITVNLPLSHLKEDASGHTLIPTYLNTNLPTYGQVMGHINDELARLVTPNAIAETGSFTTTLSWNGEGDIDLHTFEPTGAHVYYGNKSSSVGYLDLDNILGFGPEHYFASCDPNILVDGIYQIGVNNYSRAEGKTATVQISTSTVADLKTKSIVMGPSKGSSGNSNPVLLIDVHVSRDESGNISIKAF